MTVVVDPQVAAAAEAILARRGSMDRVFTMTIEGARSLRGLPAFPRLTKLTLVRCALQDLSPLQSVPSLTDLSVHQCLLANNAALSRMHGLESVEIHGGNQTELDALFELPALEYVRVLCNPLTPEAMLRAREGLGRLGADLVLPEPDTMAMTQRLHAAGAPAHAGLSTQGVWSLFRLGPKTEDVPSILYGPTEEAIYAALEEASTWEALAARLPHTSPEEPQPPQFDPDAHIQRGDAAQARAWVAALPSSTRAAVERFIDAWPELQFQRFDAPLLDYGQELDNVAFPKWLRALWGAFAGLDADRGARYHFTGFESITPDEIEAHAFGLGLRGAVSSREAQVWVRGGLYPIGGDRGTVLAINVRDPKDRRIYRVHSAELTEATPGTFGPHDATLAFSDYAALLDAVGAVTVGGVRLERSR
jgi:hypothetical protein